MKKKVNVQFAKLQSILRTKSRKLRGRFVNIRTASVVIGVFMSPRKIMIIRGKNVKCYMMPSFYQDQLHKHLI